MIYGWVMCLIFLEEGLTAVRMVPYCSSLTLSAEALISAIDKWVRSFALERHNDDLSAPERYCLSTVYRTGL